MGNNFDFGRVIRIQLQSEPCIPETRLDQVISPRLYLLAHSVLSDGNGWETQTLSETLIINTDWKVERGEGEEEQELYYKVKFCESREDLTNEGGKASNDRPFYVTADLNGKRREGITGNCLSP